MPKKTIPPTKRLKYLSFQFHHDLKSFKMTNFQPEISGGVLLTGDIDRILKPLESCPSLSSNSKCASICCIVLSFLLFLAGCKKNSFNFIKLTNFFRGISLYLWTDKFRSWGFYWDMGNRLLDWFHFNPDLSNLLSE